jgi:hypothetical protein
MKQKAVRKRSSECFILKGSTGFLLEMREQSRRLGEVGEATAWKEG